MHDLHDSAPFSMKRVEPQLDPGSLLRAQRALHSCRDVPGLAQACVTTALNLVGFDFAILLLGCPGAWAVAACAGAAAIPSGHPANVAPSLVQQLAEQRALALDGADAVSLLGALLLLPYARRVLVHAIAGDGADAAALRGALVCGYEHDDAFAAARRQALDLIAAATAWELERLRRADEYDVARLEQERARALVDASNDAIMLLDSDGRALIVNRRAKYFFGLAERDVIGRSAEQLRAMFHLIFEDGAAFDAWLTPLLASADQRAVAEFKVLRVEPRLLQCFTAPVLDQQEDLLGRLLVFRDITREREVERMKNEFVSMVSHELRTPLTSIRGALQLVIGRAHQAELPARTSELLNVSLSNSERLIRLINDILDISKIEHGAIQLRRTAIDPAELCRAAAQEVAGYAAGRGITVEVTAAEGAPPVSADRDRALQVLANLLSNAIKFSDPGQFVELSAAGGDGVARFAVRDHGRGIAPEDHQRIFEKFQQADNSLTRDVGGTGLGLAICKALVEEHGGRIWLDSAPGQGATFTFTLPLAASAEVPHYGPGHPASGALDPAPRHVLVVDDDDHVRPALVRLLERTGLRVSGVADGRAALEMVRRDPPDLILLDVRMPGADGYEVLRRLKHDSAHNQIPIVILTALDSGDDARRQALDLGAARYLEKPIASEDLLAAITNILQPPAGIR